MEEPGLEGRMEFPLEDVASSKGKSRGSGRPPQPVLHGGPEERVGVRGMSPCFPDREAEDRETNQKACLARPRQPRALTACLLRENRVIAVSIPGNTCRFLQEGRAGLMTRVPVVVGLLLRSRGSTPVVS